MQREKIRMSTGMLCNCSRRSLKEFSACFSVSLIVLLKEAMDNQKVFLFINPWIVPIIAVFVHFNKRSIALNNHRIKL